MSINNSQINQSGGIDMSPDFPVDIVLPWVDGNDPIHQTKLKRYVTSQKEDTRPDVGGEERFCDMGEIRHCIASINRFAPFVRTIHIVTDNQDPKLEKFISRLFPEGHIPMNIVSHEDIFKGYEQYLPTFNSRAIETMIWRIPGLSEHFILMNDDFFITSPLSSSDFFINGKAICYASWYSTILEKIIWTLKPRRNGHKKISFKHSMVKALEALGGGKRFIYLTHTPRALKKSFFKEYFSEHEDMIIRNIQHRFRHEEQYNSQELFYISEARRNRCVLISPKGKALYMCPSKGRRHIERKIKDFGDGKGYMFGCINSLSGAPETDRKRVIEWFRSCVNHDERPSE